MGLRRPRAVAQRHFITHVGDASAQVPDLLHGGSQKSVLDARYEASLATLRLDCQDPLTDQLNSCLTKPNQSRHRLGNQCRANCARLAGERWYQRDLPCV